MVDVPDNLLSALLRRYPDCATLRPSAAEPVRSGFSGAVVLRLETDHGPLCLRGWPPGSLPRPRILGLHRLLRFIFDQGITEIAVPLTADDGSTLINATGRFWQLEPWLPGSADFHANSTDVRLADCMNCLARWHRVAARFTPRPDERPWFASHVQASSPAVSERLQILRNWNANKTSQLHNRMKQSRSSRLREIGERILELFPTLAAPVAAQLETATVLQYPLQPCLRDIHHDHILFTGDRLTGLVDLSACRSENVAADLARLLGSLVSDDHDRWRQALRAYAAERPLTPAEEGLIPVLDHSGVLLAGLNWLERLFLRNKPIPNEEGVFDRLEALLTRLEHLQKTLEL